MSIALHKFGPQWGIADPSSFCLKVESVLRLSGLEFECPPFNPRTSFKKAPKGKIPFIEINGQLIGDSNFIIEHLKSKHQIDLDRGLTDEQKAISLAMRRLMDEHLYWAVLYSRWFDEPGWSIISPLLFGSAPKLLRGFIEKKVRADTWKRIEGHGMGKHSRDEIYALAAQDIKALSDLLGVKSFYFGRPDPSLLDVCVHAYVANIYYPPIDSPIKQAIEKYENLLELCDKLQQRIYGQLPASKA